MLDLMTELRLQLLRAAGVEVEVLQLVVVAAAIGDEIDAAVVRREPRFANICVSRGAGARRIDAPRRAGVDVHEQQLVAEAGERVAHQQ